MTTERLVDDLMRAVRTGGFLPDRYERAEIADARQALLDAIHLLGPDDNDEQRSQRIAELVASAKDAAYLVWALPPREGTKALQEHERAITALAALATQPIHASEPARMSEPTSASEPQDMSEPMQESEPTCWSEPKSTSAPVDSSEPQQTSEPFDLSEPKSASDPKS